MCLVPGLDKVGDAAECHFRRCHCRSLQSQSQSGTSCLRLRRSTGLRLCYRSALLPQPWEIAESFFPKVSATLRLDILSGKVRQNFSLARNSRITSFFPREQLTPDNQSVRAVDFMRAGVLFSALKFEKRWCRYRSETKQLP